MNDRINELAIKSGGIWRGGYVDQPNGDSVWTDRKFVVDVDTEQFAELIVKECAQVASNQVMDVEGNDWGVRHAVETHFGVEE